MTGQTVSRVEASLDPNYRCGDVILAPSGWQEFAVSDGRDLTRLPAGLPRLSSALGMGGVVGQIAKIKGCRVVGIAGGAEKCRWAVNELGFNACIDHRAPLLDDSLAAACPRGIDVYFENVGGKIFRAVVPLLNAHARFPVCGLIAHYGMHTKPADPDWVPTLMRAMVKRITMRGFMIYDDCGHRFEEFLAAMQAWLRDGRIKYREDIVHGLQNAPQAFLGLLVGRNFGKLVVCLDESQGSSA